MINNFLALRILSFKFLSEENLKQKLNINNLYYHIIIKIINTIKSLVANKISSSTLRESM